MAKCEPVREALIFISRRGLAMIQMITFHPHSICSLILKILENKLIYLKLICIKSLILF